jgi:hypothetical protein
MIPSVRGEYRGTLLSTGRNGAAVAVSRREETKVRTIWRLALVVVGMVVLVAAPAFAETSVDYPGGKPPVVGGVEIANPSAPAVSPAVAVQPQVAGVEIVAPAPTAAGLALTGADIAGMVVIALGAIGIGVVIVRRTRHRTA